MLQSFLCNSYLFSQLLALAALISAAICQSTVSRSALRDSGLVPDVATFDAAAWVIFLSFWVMLYQTLAIVQLFIRVDVLYITIPFLNWSIFFLVVNIANTFIHRPLLA